MFDHFLVVLVAAAGSAWAVPDTNSHTVARLRLEVSGPVTAGCAKRLLAIPISGGGAIHAEIEGVRYTGFRASNRLLVVRSDEPRALSVTGDESTGGRWSRGGDGRCVGRWWSIH